ncbi:MAG: hypothetical protein P8173_16090 [Gammaproteobacteria bacterium]
MFIIEVVITYEVRAIVTMNSITKIEGAPETARNIMIEVEISDVAWHEAAHAVMAWYVGAAIGKVMIESTHEVGMEGLLVYGREDAEPGDTGVFLWGNGYAHDRVSGDLRPQTEAERDHFALMDKVFAWEPRQCNALICAAGEAAQIMMAPDRFHSSQSENDRSCAEEYLSEGETWEELVNRVTNFLREPMAWRRVTALAAALMATPTIDGLTAKRIIVKM